MRTLVRFACRYALFDPAKWHCRALFAFLNAGICTRGGHGHPSDVHLRSFAAGIGRGMPTLHVRVLGDGRGIKAVLEDGSVAYGDVLVGADGVWSQVHVARMPKTCLHRRTRLH